MKTWLASIALAAAALLLAALGGLMLGVLGATLKVKGGDQLPMEPRGPAPDFTLKDVLQGKILIDVTVPLQPPKVRTVFVPEGKSASLEAQALLGPGVSVVTAYQNVSAIHLQSGSEHVDCDVLICGDDESTKNGIKQYLLAVSQLRLSLDEEASFLCSVKIEHGFLLPLNLLAGLMSRFSDDWDPIISSYDRMSHRGFSAQHHVHHCLDRWFIHRAGGKNGRKVPGEIRLRNPRLPAFLNDVTLRDLRLGTSSVDLRIHRHGKDVSLEVMGTRGQVQVSLVLAS